MGLKRTYLGSLACLLISFGAVMAQDTPAPPAVPSTPEAPGEFTFYLGSGSFLGIYPEEITRENMAQYNLREARGVAVSKVVEGSPAEKAGLKKGDVVLRFNGEEVTSVRKLNRMISEVAPDRVVRLSISRNGAEQEMSITVGKRENFNTVIAPGGELSERMLDELKRAPGAYAYSFGSGRRIGVGTSTLTKQLADYFGVRGGKGLLITNVKENSPAEKAGLKAGDVIIEADGEKIEQVGDLSGAINRKSEGEITLTIVRDKSERTFRVTPEKGGGLRLLAPEFDIEAAPRVGLLAVPNIRITPQVRKIVLPRIEALPRIKALVGTRAL